ncbi:CACTA en-spm transposon protein [Cucumis melo var. makuwa]|uniref:CACTA en-spm transposon protein n=1 Tax=Cucumis melo var. makuwa TaxID=1194695 RepID=A0A5A7TVQ0_CUCMM|nr:CACTA en-spm transposon protein [Cucumis melo var. makuwa]TYK04825.1 CACTA en-spm transposon protein [Cucumis melo var. makuwa]
MSSFACNNFLETDAMFLEFAEGLDNLAGSSFQPSTTPTPRRRSQSRLLELERYVAGNGRVSMTIAPSAEKPISPHVVCFNKAVDMCVRKTFLVRCLQWVDTGREYIEVVKADLVRFFVLDFNDQAMNRFVEHQMLNTLKSFGAIVTGITKSATTSRRLVPTHHTYWWDVMRIDTFSTNKVARQKQSYSDSNGSKMFLQRQHEQKEEFVDRVECFSTNTPLRHDVRVTDRRGCKCKIKCWNTSPNLPHRVISHSLGMRYAIKCWVDDWATQKALVGAQGESLRDDECK